MSDELKKAQERIAQLEKSMRDQQLTIPDKPDPSLEKDEWYAIFSNYQDLTTGYITKIPPRALLGSSSMFVVKKIVKLP